MPLTHLVEYDGPIVSFTSPDSIDPTPLVYSFDPPIVLPRPSTYCFWIQETCSGWGDFLIDGLNGYKDGSLWGTFRSNFEGCILRAYPENFAGADLVFSLVFCNTHTTPTRRQTWGELKARYR